VIPSPKSIRLIPDLQSKIENNKKWDHMKKCLGLHLNFYSIFWQHFEMYIENEIEYL